LKREVNTPNGEISLEQSRVLACQGKTEKKKPMPGSNGEEKSDPEKIGT